jgi:hypothetical protein
MQYQENHRIVEKSILPGQGFSHAGPQKIGRQVSLLGSDQRPTDDSRAGSPNSIQEKAMAEANHSRRVTVTIHSDTHNHVSCRQRNVLPRRHGHGDLHGVRLSKEGPLASTPSSSRITAHK